MDKNKIKLLVTGTLTLVFVIVMANSIKTVMDRNKAASIAGQFPARQQSFRETVPTDTSEVTRSGQVPRETVVGLEPVSYSGHGEIVPTEAKVYRDPFKRQAKQMAPGAGAKSTKDGLAGGVLLTGIVYDIKKPAESYCIINGQSLKEGDTIAGFTVADINEDFVTLNETKENKYYKLDIWGQLEEIL
jgi:hypothetical protein